MKRYKVLVESMNRTEPLEHHRGEWVKYEDAVKYKNIVKRFVSFYTHGTVSTQEFQEIVNEAVALIGEGK